MKKPAVLFALLLISFPVISEDNSKILEEIDALVSFPETDFSAKYTIVHDVPGEGQTKTVAAVFRRDNEDIYVISVLEPDSSHGQGYLKQGDTLWFYDPESRVFNSTSSKERFQNSSARNSDFTKSTLAEDYDITKKENEQLGQYKCIVLSLKANNDEVTYPYTKIWVSEDKLVRKTEDYSLSGRLLRTTMIPSYRKVQNRYIPYKILIIDNLLGAEINGVFVNEKTQITIDSPALEKLPDNTFSKTFLEKLSI